MSAQDSPSEISSTCCKGFTEVKMQFLSFTRQQFELATRQFPGFLEQSRDTIDECDLRHQIVSRVLIYPRDEA